LLHLFMQRVHVRSISAPSRTLTKKQDAVALNGVALHHPGPCSDCHANLLVPKSLPEWAISEIEGSQDRLILWELLQDVLEDE